MPSNEHPNMDGAYPDERGFMDADMEIAFRAGAQQMREMLARFVENGPASDPKVIAQSMRLNWVPTWGGDPGQPDEVCEDLWAAW